MGPFFFFCSRFYRVRFFANMVRGQWVGASVLRLTSRAAAWVRCRLLANTVRDAYCLWQPRMEPATGLPQPPSPMRGGCANRQSHPAPPIVFLLVCPHAFEGGWCGLAGAGSIRGCHRVGVPAAPLMNQSRRYRSSRPRGEPEPDSSTIHLARVVGGNHSDRHKSKRPEEPAA